MYLVTKRVKGERKGDVFFMRYQIYLSKDVSDIINAISKGVNKKPNTLIKELLESNFRTAYADALSQGVLQNEHTKK